ICGGGIRNPVLMQDLETLFSPDTKLHSTAKLHLDPQWVEAAAFAWLAACWCNQVPSNPHHATGAHSHRILGSGHYGN
ncbi:anhydro-N-acetylmuramic acid kinase, partial [Neisseria sp. P0009.S007]